MKRLFAFIFCATLLVVSFRGYSQCGTAVQNLIEDFNTLPDPNDRSVLPDCWSSVGGLTQMDANELLLALLGSSNPGTLITPNVENGEGVITFKARKSSSYTVYLSVGYYSGGFIEAVKYTLGSSYQTYTYDFANFGSKISTATNIAFKITSGPNSGVQQLRLDDIEYKSFCQPAGVPTAVAKDITVKLDATGNVIVNPANVDNGSTDDCGEFITNFNLDKTLFTCDDLGINVVTLTATDSEGHTATAAANITIEPDFVFNSNQLALDENGESNVALDFLTSSKTDCSTVTYALDRTTFTCDDAGYYLFTVTATYNGTSKDFTATKNISDYIYPEAIAQDIAVNIDESTGLAIITPEMIDNGSMDNCGIASLSLSKSSFDCADQGENEVILTVTDNAGRSSTASAMVTVGSFIEDVVLSSSSTTVCFDGSNGNAGATIETDGSTVGTQYYLRTDADSLVVDGPIDGTGSGLTFNTGAVSENTTFHVYGEVPFSGKAIDLTDNGRTAHLSVNTPGGFDYAAGYTISAWVKLGASGNSTFYNGIFYAGGATGSDIEVYENSSGNITILHNRGNGGSLSSYVIPGNAITNNTYVHFAATYNGLASRVFVNGVEVGAATLTAPAKSGSSEMTFGYLNSSTFPAAQSFPGIVDDIRVYDRALTSADILADYDKCISGSEDDLVLYFDLESVSGSIYTDLVSGTPAQIKNGGFPTDDAAISCSFTCNKIMTNKITIGDDMAPIVITQAVSIQLSASGSANITVEDVDNGSSDNCTEVSSLMYTLDRSSFSCEDAGDNIVTLTVTDEAGNSTTETATVTVQSVIEDEVVTATELSLCPNNDDGTVISIGSSVESIEYFLRNSENNNVIDGPIAGTGGALDFNTGELTQETTFNVFGSSETSEPFALQFAKGNEYVAAGEDTDFRYDAGYTVETWVNAPFATNTSHAILDYGTASSSDLQIYVQGSTGYLTIVHDRSSGTAHTYYRYPTPPRNQWAHIAVTYDGGTSGVKVYYDGVEQTIVDSYNPSGLLTKRAGALLSIGRALTFVSSNDSFQGKMDEVRIWDTPRTLAELNNNMGACLSGTATGLVSYFQFNEGSGTIVDDLAGGNDGTLTNMDENTDWITDFAFACTVCEWQMTTEITVSLGDLEIPDVVTRDFILILGSNTSGTITVADINNGSTDNCTAQEDLTMSLDITTFDNTQLGNHTVTLTVTDESGNIGASTATVTVSDKFEQIISFGTLIDKTYGDAAFDLSATSGSGLTIDFSIVDGPATISGTTVNITGIGTVLVEANQAGDTDFAPATPVQQTFDVTTAVLTVTADNQTITYGDAIPVLGQTYTGFVNDETVADLAELALASTTAELNSDAGSYGITLAGGAAINYELILVDGTLTIEKADQSITADVLTDMTIDDVPFDLTAIASSDLEVSYIIDGPATLSGATVTLTGLGGIVTITVSQAGNLNFNAAEDVIVSFEVIDNSCATLAIQVVGSVEAQCFGSTTGGIDISVSGGTAPYNYLWSNTAVTEDLSGLVAGTYDLEVTDARGCIVNTSFKIEEPTLLEVTATPNGNSITAIATGGTAAYEYSLDGVDFQSGSVFSDLTAGNYSVTVRDANGCIAETEALSIVISSVSPVTGFALYPNPVRDVLNIENSLSVVIYDLLGHQILSVENSARIDMSHVEAGVYVLIATTVEGIVIREKLIKEN